MWIASISKKSLSRSVWFIKSRSPCFLGIQGASWGWGQEVDNAWWWRGRGDGLFRRVRVNYFLTVTPDLFVLIVLPRLPISYRGSLGDLLVPIDPFYSLSCAYHIYWQGTIPDFTPPDTLGNKCIQAPPQRCFLTPHPLSTPCQ